MSILIVKKFFSMCMFLFFKKVGQNIMEIYSSFGAPMKVYVYFVVGPPPSGPVMSTDLLAPMSASSAAPAPPKPKANYTNVSLLFLVTSPM